jgi:hypothetical protein
MMVQLFAKQEDEKRCRDSIVVGQTLSLTGLSMSGKADIVSGVVMSVLGGQTLYREYPLLVTLIAKTRPA